MCPQLNNAESKSSKEGEKNQKGIKAKEQYKSNT